MPTYKPNYLPAPSAGGAPSQPMGSQQAQAQALRAPSRPRPVRGQNRGDVPSVPEGNGIGAGLLAAEGGELDRDDLNSSIRRIVESMGDGSMFGRKPSTGPGGMGYRTALAGMNGPAGLGESVNTSGVSELSGAGAPPANAMEAILSRIMDLNEGDSSKTLGDAMLKMKGINLPPRSSQPFKPFQA